jgi:Tol biopolymer transport system component
MNSYPILSAIVLSCGFAGAQSVRLTTGSGGGERQPVLSADGGTVAYLGVAAGVREVFTVSTLGGSPVRRTTGADVLIGGNSAFDSWPALSIDAAGTRVTYWSRTGVHVLDLVASTDVVVSPSALLSYPCLDSAGALVAYQAPVGGDLEVFVVPAGGGTAQQLTSGSGPGRRLPHVRGNLVALQRSVAGTQEVFVYDLVTNTLSAPLTTASGRGNRYARLANDGTKVVYEAVVGTIKHVFVHDLATTTRRQVTTASASGDRLPSPTVDGEAVCEILSANLDVVAADLATSAVVTLSTGAGAGHRRPTVDEHGTIVVYQEEYQGACEVFALRLCYAPGITHYGTAGVPSTGVLQERDRVYRRTFELGLGTSLAQGRAAVLMLGIAPASTPLPNAPGNTIYVQPLVAVSGVLDASGAITFGIPSPVALAGSTGHAQWAVADAAANPLGIVTARGVRVDFP